MKEIIILLLSVIVLTQIGNASTIWTGDYETGNVNQWSYTKPATTEYSGTPYPILTYPRVAIQSNEVRQGKYAAKFTVYPGDYWSIPSGATDTQKRNRISVGKYSIIDASTNPDLYYGFSFKYPSTSSYSYKPGDWLLIQSTGTVGENQCGLHSCTFFGINYLYSSDQLQVGYNIDIEENEVHINIPNYNRGDWIDIIYRIKYSTTSTGILQLWTRNQAKTSWDLVIDAKNIRTDWTPTGGDHLLYIQEAAYRGNYNYVPFTTPQTIYFDSNYVSTSLQETKNHFDIGSIVPTSSPTPIITPSPSPTSTVSPHPIPTPDILTSIIDYIMSILSQLFVSR